MAVSSQKQTYFKKMLNLIVFVLLPRKAIKKEAKQMDNKRFFAERSL